MSLSPQAIAEFKQIYYEDYGIALTDAEALELATSFFNLMRVICQPWPGRDCKPEEEMV